MGQGAPGNVLQTGLVVHDNIGIVLGVLVHLGFQHAVDVAIAALALGAPHDNHVEIIVFNQGIIEFHLGIVRLGHALGNGALQLGLSHFFPNLPQGNVCLHAQHLVEVGVGIGIHHQDRPLMLFAQVINNHTAGCGFAHAALAGDCNGMGSCHKKRSFARTFCIGMQIWNITYRYKYIVTHLIWKFNPFSKKKRPSNRKTGAKAEP